MNRLIKNRRDFLKHTSLAAMAFPFVIGCKGDTLARTGETKILTLIKRNANTAPEVNWCGAIDAPYNVSWETTLARKFAKDEPVVISGTVFQTDGNTPAPNVLIYFYHTDSDGYYGNGKPGPQHGHFRGWLLTGADGRYRFSSFKPAPYPLRTQSAHIHMTLTGTKFKEDSIDSILFEGDKFITPLERELAGKKGGFNPVVTFAKDKDGVWQGVRNIQLTGA